MSWESWRSLRARAVWARRPAHSISGDAVPVSVEGCGLRIEEYESGGIGRQVGVVIERAVERSAEVVGAEDVEAGVTDKGSCAGHGVEYLADAAPELRRRCAGPPLLSGGGGVDQVDQVCVFDFVELENPTQVVDDLVRDTAGVTSLEAGVVLDADTGEQGNFFPAQPRNPPPAAVVG